MRVTIDFDDISSDEKTKLIEELGLQKEVNTATFRRNVPKIPQLGGEFFQAQTNAVKISETSTSETWEYQTEETIYFKECPDLISFLLLYESIDENYQVVLNSDVVHELVSFLVVASWDE